MKQNKHQLEHLPTLLVQQIRLQWYKDCRGGNAAAQRNQYPRAMRLPKDFFSYLSRIEQNINDNGFTTRRATEQDLKKMLGVYFEQNVTTEKFEDFDGDRWVIVGE